MLLETILITIIFIALALEVAQWRRTASFLARHDQQQRGRDIRARVLAEVAKLREVQP